MIYSAAIPNANRVNEKVIGPFLAQHRKRVQEMTAMIAEISGMLSTHAWTVDAPPLSLSPTIMREAFRRRSRSLKTHAIQSILFCLDGWLTGRVTNKQSRRSERPSSRGLVEGSTWVERRFKRRVPRDSEAGSRHETTNQSSKL